MKYLQNFTKMSSLQRGDIVQHKTSGDSYVVEDIMKNKAIAVTTIVITNAEEWQVLREETKPDNKHRADTNVVLQTEKFVDDYIAHHGKSPTYRQVMEQFNLSSTSAAYARLRRYRHKMKTN